MYTSMLSRLVLLLVGISLCLSANGQRKLLRQAKAYYDAQKYYDAIDIYNQIPKKKEGTLLFLGKAQYEVGQYHDALVSLSHAYKSGSRDKQLYIYTALCLHRLERYEEAASFYKDYLSKNQGCEAFILRELKKIEYALGHQHVERSSYIENMGSTINTRYREKKAYVSPSSDERLYFSSDRPGSYGGLRNKKGLKDEIYGHYAYDMYSAASASGSWRMTEVFADILNGPKHEILQGFNNDGSVLFFTRVDSEGKGSLKVDTFRRDEQDAYLPPSLSSPIQVDEGDRDIIAFGDSLLLFSSNTLGGYGGYDLFMIRRTKEGWSAPINMGNQINSPYHEKSPYLSKSGLNLYFSSNRIDSYGGYDIFSSRYGRESGGWSKPQNEGLPINSPADETHISLSNDGRIAYITSNRMGSQGYSDIYRAIFKTPRFENYQIWDIPLFVTDLDREDIDTIQESDEAPKTQDEVIQKDTVGKQSIHITPLYFGVDDNVLTTINQGLLDELARNMKIFPHLEVLLMGHASGDELPEYSLYFSIKRAEKIQSYLINQGIEKARITCFGWGNYFPLATGKTPIASNSNRRIDIRLIDPKEQMDISYEQNNIQTSLRDPRYLEYKDALNGLSYTIQVHTSNQMYIDDLLSNNRMLVEKSPSVSDYRYEVGLFSSYAEARKKKNMLIKSGYSKARIVPYVKGVRLDNTKIETYRNQYPDLEDYLLYE